MRAPLVSFLAVGLALALGGCDKDPYADDLRETATPTPSPTIAATEPLPPREPEPPPVIVELGHKATPELALRAFGTRWTNWSWRDVKAQQRALARMATGEYGRQLLEQSVTAASPEALRREKPSYRGRVEAAVVRGGRDDRRTGLVVLREKAYLDARPLQGGVHWRTYVAHLRQTARGWAISGWEGQP